MMTECTFLDELFL